MLLFGHFICVDIIGLYGFDNNYVVSPALRYLDNNNNNIRVVIDPRLALNKMDQYYSI